MPEEQPVQGNWWTDEAVKLLTSIGWRQRGDTQVDVPCTLHSDGSKSHGIDSYFTYYDPYQTREIGLMVETKNYKWKNIDKSFLQESVDQLVDKMECAPHSDDFVKKLNPTKAKTDAGIILLWAKDTGYDRAKFQKYLDGVDISKRRNTMRVYVLDNSDILRMYSFANSIQKMVTEVAQGGSFDIYYPSYKATDSLKGFTLLTLEYLKSRFVFAKITRMQKEPDGSTRAKTGTVVFYFDKIEPDNLRYMYLALRHFQLTDNEILIYHYESPIAGRSPLKEFKRTYGYENNDIKKMEFRPMERIAEVPFSDR